MTPEFSALVDPIFQSVLGFVRRIEGGQHYDLQQERSKIRNVIDDAERQAITPRSAVQLQDFQVAKQALVYWADEVLTEAASDWKDILLEREYFESRTRAWKFYVEGELTGRHSSPDVTETFYLCVVLGFVGDIRDAFKNHLNRELPGNTDDPEAARQAWARQLEQRLRETPQSELAGEPLDGHIAPLTGRTLFRVSQVVFGIAVLLCAIGWLFSLMSKTETGDDEEVSVLRDASYVQSNRYENELLNPDTGRPQQTGVTA
ncbi:MAG: DotU family type IV/VI secretion system protein [Planctomycetaceae bacterium]